MRPEQVMVITPIPYSREGMSDFHNMESSLEEMWKDEDLQKEAKRVTHKKRTTNGIYADDTRENFNSSKFSPWTGPKKDKLPEEEIE